jgi:hypothetical protein
MSFLPKDELEPGQSGKPGNGNKKGVKKGPTTTRVAMWIITGAFALYLIGSGLYGILT